MRGGMILRNFLYLDESLLIEFLAQLEGGVAASETRRTTSDRSRGIRGSLGTSGMAHAGGELRRRTQDEAEFVVHQTRASQFDRLHRLLTEKDALGVAEPSADLKTLARGKMVEVTGPARVLGLGGLSEMLEMLDSLSEVMDPAEIDASELGQIELFRKFLGRATPDIAVSVTTGEPPEEFGAVMKMDAGLEARAELAGEVSMLGKLLRRVEDGQNYVVQDPLGGLLATAPPAARAELLANLDSEEMRGFGVSSPEVAGPAWIVLPVAVYR